MSLSIREHWRGRVGQLPLLSVCDSWSLWDRAWVFRHKIFVPGCPAGFSPDARFPGLPALPGIYFACGLGESLLLNKDNVAFPLLLPSDRQMVETKAAA